MGVSSGHAGRYFDAKRPVNGGRAYGIFKGREVIIFSCKSNIHRLKSWTT